MSIGEYAARKSEGKATDRKPGGVTDLPSDVQPLSHNSPTQTMHTVEKPCEDKI